MVYVSYAPSAPTFDNIIALNGKDARTYLDRAYTHLFNGDYDGAETDYRRAMCLNPSDEDVKQRLARIGRVPCTMP
jgi:Flp pilus assembly protein TadD